MDASTSARPTSAGSPCVRGVEWIVGDGQQAAHRNGVGLPLHRHRLRWPENRGVLHLCGGALTEHDAVGRGDGLHPLCQTDVLADGGVSERSRADLAGDDLPGVQSHPQMQCDTVACANPDCDFARLFAYSECGPARQQRMVLQCERSAEHRHHAVAGELADHASMEFDDVGRAVHEFGHDLAETLGSDGSGDVHRSHDIGEHDGDLLVLAGDRTGCARPAAVAEAGLKA